MFPDAPGNPPSISPALSQGQVTHSLALEIISGRTRFPHRVMVADRIVIGSASRCDLRLGGADMPAIHSVLILTANELLLEQISDQPPLIIDGQARTSSVLQGGETIQIGPIAFTVRRAAYSSQSAAPLNPEPHTRLTPGWDSAGWDSTTAALRKTHMIDEQPSERRPCLPLDEERAPRISGAPPIPETTAELEDLTAMELIDLIEQSDAEIREFENRREEGATALLDEIHRRQRRRQGSKLRFDDAAPAIPTPHLGKSRIPVYQIDADPRFAQPVIDPHETPEQLQDHGLPSLLQHLDALQRELARVDPNAGSSQLQVSESQTVALPIRSAAAAMRSRELQRQIADVQARIDYLQRDTVTRRATA